MGMRLQGQEGAAADLQGLVAAEQHREGPRTPVAQVVPTQPIHEAEEIAGAQRSVRGSKQTLVHEGGVQGDVGLGHVGWGPRLSGQQQMQTWWRGIRGAGGGGRHDDDDGCACVREPGPH